MTTPTRAEMCADLARAMGWTVTDACVLHPSPERCWFSPDGKSQHADDPPDPFTNAEHNRALVAWLAQDDARWKEFKQELLSDWASSPEQDVVRFVLTAPLETIALAA